MTTKKTSNSRSDRYALIRLVSGPSSRAYDEIERFADRHEANSKLIVCKTEYFGDRQAQIGEWHPFCVVPIDSKAGVLLPLIEGDSPPSGFTAPSEAPSTPKKKQRRTKKIAVDND